MADEFKPNSPQRNYPNAYYIKPKSRKWQIPVAIVAGIVILFFVCITLLFNSLLDEQEIEIGDNSVLNLNLGTIVDEYATQSPFSIFTGTSQLAFNEILSAIKTASADNRIKGIYYRGNLTTMGWAKAKELQDALEEFKKTGKFIYSFIEAGRENEYYNALPSDKIFMPSEGILEMNGFGASVLFFKGFFNRIGIDFYVQGFEDFKSAGEQFSRDKFSDSAKYQLRVLLNQRLKFLLNSITHFRKLDSDFAKSCIDRGIYTADSLLALGFIDSIATESEVKEYIKTKLNFTDNSKDKYKNISKNNDKLNLVTIKQYLNDKSTDKGVVAPPDKQIAIINAVGPIQSNIGGGPFGNEKVITAERMVRYLTKAREDDNIKIIILRIDSPGGSVMASDAIREEIIKTKKIKPVYASMSDVAASGGYYIAMDCDTIIAYPNTITGSIGVISMIPNLSGLLGKLNFGVDTISVNTNSLFLDGSKPFTQNDKNTFYNISKSIYTRFVQKVAKARHKGFEETRALAKGRVWTGEDAKARGLVDILGDYRTAIKLAKKRIGISEDIKIRVRMFPEKIDQFEALLKFFKQDKSEDDYSNLSKLYARLIGCDESLAIQTYKALPTEMKNQIDYLLFLLNSSKNEKALFAMPNYYFY